MTNKPLIDHRFFSALILTLLTLPAFSSASPQTRMLPLSGDLRAHDPVIAKEGGVYYVFTTGGRPGSGQIPVLRSRDLFVWEKGGYAFESMPAWAPKEIPGTRDIWAPDISYFNGRWHLYYAVSTFGKNGSAIGLATNLALDPNSPDYQWIDHGMVLRSTEGVDDWNAIDANIAIEDNDHIWLCWGSFWSGIKMRRIDPQTGKLSDKDSTLYALASRPRGKEIIPPTHGAIEAPFLFRRDGFWYLFASFDQCCQGAKSTYNIVVGRSVNIIGPYVDRDGKPMLEGGGTLLLAATTPNWKGPGHNAVFHENNQDYLVFHAYHGQTGKPELKISTLEWENGWPLAAPLP